MMFKTIDGELKVFNKTILSTQNNLKNLQNAQVQTIRIMGGNGTNVRTEGSGIVTSEITAPIAQPQTVSNFTKLNNAFKVYNGNLTKSTGLQNAYIKSVGGQNQALGNYLAGLNGAKASMGGYIASLISAKAATIALQVASMALNMALSMGVAFAIQGIIALFDKLITTSKEQAEKLQNVKQEYENVKSELQSLNDELKTTEEKMTELENKDTLTFTEKKEYDNLVKTNNELQRKIDLLELEEKIKNKEKNKTFVDTMNKSGNAAVTMMGNTTSIKTKDFAMAEIGRYESLVADGITEDEEKQVEYLEGYLQDLSDEWGEYAKDISYISNPTNKDEEKVNEWLDFVNDFQDRMAIAMGGTNAETNAFNRVVDNWQFDEVVQGLQDLGEEGKVTAEMLNDHKYDEFIQKLVYLGIIDSADNLDEIALAFNNVGTEAESSGGNVNKMTVSLEDVTKTLSTLQGKYNELKSAQDEYNSTGAISAETMQKLIDNDLLQYLDYSSGKLRINTDALLSEGEAAKVNAIQKLQDAMATDLMNLATGKTDKLSNTAKTAIANLGNAAETTGGKAETAAAKLAGFAIAAQAAKDGAEGKLTGMSVDDFNAQADAIISAYTSAANSIGNITIKSPNASGSKGSSSGSSSGSYKNEVLDKYLEDAEKRYKVHQDETKYIEELDYALNKLVKTDEERLEILDKIEDARKDYADNRIKDLEHEKEMLKNMYGDNYDTSYIDRSIQQIHHEEAERLRALGYDDNSDEIQEHQSGWWDKQNELLDNMSLQYENRIKDIEHARDMFLEQNPLGDTTSFYKQLQEEYHKEAERLRALDPEKYKEEIQELQNKWWEAHDAIVDWRWNNSQNWISDRNTYNDWALFDDSEVDAWERVVKWLKEEYPNDLEKIKEAEQSLFEARKKEFDKANDLGSTYIESKKTLLQSYYDVTNSIAEAQHEINKELETSKTMYEWLDEDTRKLLFNQEDYNILSEELLDIQYQAQKLQRQYKRDLNNSTLETVESITSNYQMQYETLMKSYEIAKADLEIAKKKQKLNNVLNERNVRMFINGQWQWVADTEQVANAKAELADAEYAKRVEESGLTQQESINNLIRQQDELSVVVNNFESGVITLDEAVTLAKNAIGSMPSALYSMFKSIDVKIPSYSSSSLKANPTGYLGKKVNMANSLYQFKTKVNQHADGTRYTPGGLTALGEEEPEVYITANGRLVPINQPTIGNIGAGGVVFNQDQMKGFRALWDMSNLNFNTDRNYITRQPQQIDQSQDNRIIINGMTISEQGNEDWIEGLRRCVYTHKGSM